jgi:hypothetical protein
MVSARLRDILENPQIQEMVLVCGKSSPIPTESRENRKVYPKSLLQVESERPL